MKEHPIPQDITGYKFHLIGNMTLKQFAEIMAGSILALITFKSGLPNLIRLPFAFIFATLGVMAAFVPIEERPLDHWITTFIKVMFKPTKFYWKKKTKIPDLFNYTPSKESVKAQQEVNLSPARKKRIYQFLQSIDHAHDSNLDEFDLAQQQRIGGILSQFNQIQISPQQKAELKPLSNKTTQTNKKPSLQVRVRKMKDLSNHTTIFPVSNQVTNAETTSQTPSTQTQTLRATATNPTNSQQTVTNKQQTSSATKELSELSQDNQAAVRTQMFVKPTKPTKPKPTPAIQLSSGQIGGAVFSINGELVPNALIEVRDASNNTVTAVSTNSLGQFLVSQQLSVGDYFLIAKSPGFQFEPHKVTLSTEQPNPIKIKAVG